MAATEAQVGDTQKTIKSRAKTVAYRDQNLQRPDSSGFVLPSKKQRKCFFGAMGGSGPAISLSSCCRATLSTQEHNVLEAAAAADAQRADRGGPGDASQPGGSYTDTAASAQRRSGAATECL